MRSVLATRVWLTSAVLMLLGICLAVLASPSASAALREDRAIVTTAGGHPVTTGPSLPPGSTAPRMLASTGLDLTVPVVLGLSILVLGTVMVGWVFLATGRQATGSGATHR